MQIITSYPQTGDRLEHVIEATTYIEEELFQSQSPFLPTSILQRVARKYSLRLLRVLEKILAKQLLIKNEDQELRAFSKPVRLLLSKLLEKKIIYKWEIAALLFKSERCYKAVIKAAEITLDDGKRISSLGLVDGSSVRQSCNDALLVALAELIERYNSVRWNRQSCTVASITEMKSAHKSIFDKQYYRLNENFDQTLKVSWVQGYELFTKRTIWLPTSSMYYLYQDAHPEEMLFCGSSSNGVAAHTTIERAILGSIYEQIERDGFMMYWLNKITPRRIALNTITDPVVIEIIEDYRARGFSLNLLDCKTEFGIPIIVLVAIDNETGAVNVNAAAGMGINNLITKVFLDHVKWNPYAHYSEEHVHQKDILTLDQRAALWYGGSLVDEILFMVSGKEITLSEYEAQFTLLPAREHEAYREVLSAIKKISPEVYVYQYPNQLPVTTGLEVVRVVIPEVLPIYFKESEKHLNVDRIYTFAQKMGFATRRYTSADLNMTPHPFI